MIWVPILIIDALMIALNAALYVDNPNPWSAGAVVFVGLMFIWALAMLVRDVGR